MDASLCLGDGHALHTVDAAFVLQHAVHALAGDAHHNLLVSSRGAFACTRDFDFPALALAEADVHACEVAGEESGLVAAGATSHLDDGVLRVLRVFGYEQEFDFLFHAWQGLLGGIYFLACHGAEFLIGFAVEQLFAVIDVGEQLAIAASSGEQVLERLVFFSEFYVTLTVGDNGRVGNQGADFLKTGVEAVETFQ